MTVIRNLVERLHGAQSRSGDTDELDALKEKCALYEHSIDTVLLLANRMTGHPHRSVRGYSASIQRVLGPFADPPATREFDSSIVLPGGVTVSQTVAVFLRRWGDDLEGEDAWTESDDPSSALAAPETPAVEARRAWLCTDWLVRTHTAAWLQIAGLPDDAQLLRSLDPIDSSAALKQAELLVRSVAQRAERQRARLSTSAAARRRAGAEEGSAPSAYLVQIARSAWAASAAGAAVEAGAAWCPQASRATEAALWTWALRRSGEQVGSQWRSELQEHVDHLQHTALELVEEMILFSPPVVRATEVDDR